MATIYNGLYPEDVKRSGSLAEDLSITDWSAGSRWNVIDTMIAPNFKVFRRAGLIDTHLYFKYARENSGARTKKNISGAISERYRQPKSDVICDEFFFFPF